MEYRRLGETGLLVSAISLGSWATIGEQLDDRASRALIARAYDCGINFFDSAETYADGRSEEALGRALQRLRLPRETYLVSGKVFWGVHQRTPNSWGLTRKHVTEGCNAALGRLRVDHLDLYLCHRPDPDTPLSETVQAMSDLVRQGKVLHWGTSEWPADTLRQVHQFARANSLMAPVVEQVQYNMLTRDRVEREYRDLQENIGFGITTWSPLAYGLLAGRYDQDFPAGARLTSTRYRWLRESVLGVEHTAEDEALARIRRVNALAADLGLAPSQLALAWVLRCEHVSSAITGASQVAHIEQNVRAIDAVPLLDKETLREIDSRLGLDRSLASRGV